MIYRLGVLRAVVVDTGHIHHAQRSDDVLEIVIPDDGTEFLSHIWLNADDGTNLLSLPLTVGAIGGSLFTGARGLSAD